MRSVRNENGTGGSSPGCISRPAQSMVRAVEPRRRAGLQPAQPQARARSRRSDSPLAGASPYRPAGIFSSPLMDQPAQEGAGGQHHRAARDSSARRAVTTPATAAVRRRSDPPPRASITSRFGVRPDRGLHGRAVELAVGLGARPLHGRALGAVEQAELDAGRVGHPPHQPVQRIDLAHQMALAEPADGRVAGHLADGLELCVSSAVRAPMRAAAAAASQPAWPPPITITSKPVFRIDPRSNDEYSGSCRDIITPSL